MQKNTSVTLGDYLEEHELSLTILRQALQDGEKSGLAEYSLNDLLEELDQELQFICSNPRDRLPATF
jgi:Bacterial antitoxin of ParD toxin-antitoxin type II system and RHH